MLQYETLPHPEVFRKAIWMHPDDDALRLRYAEWLDRRFEPLGEFIRVQCELARDPGDQALAWELERREQEMLAEFGEAWVGPVKEIVDWWVFRRGFIAEVGMRAASFVSHADALMAAAPIQELHLSEAATSVGALARCAALERVRHLDLSNNYLRDTGVTVLAQSLHLANIHSLNLASTAVGNLGLQTLVNAPQLSSLRELYLCDNRIGATGARALAQSTLGRQLRAVHLRFNDLSRDSADLLRRAFGDRVRL
jgi:uncharacterized protein (TIGR02996 family)